MRAEPHPGGLVGAFLRTLADLPDATGTVLPGPRPAAEPPAGAAGAGFGSGVGHGPVPIAVRLGAAAFTVLAATRTVVFPLDVHQALSSFAAATKPGRGAMRPFLLAEAIAPDARRLLQDEQVGYYDRGGSLFLPTPGPGVVIDRPPPRLADAVPRTDPDLVFSGRAGRVLLALLDRPDDRFRVNRLARETGVSAGTVSQVFDTLTRQGWLGRAGDERFLPDPGAVLAAWTRQPAAGAAPPARWVAGPEPLTLLARLVDLLGDRGIDYSLRGALAARLHAGLPRRAESLDLRWLAAGAGAALDLDALVDELAAPGAATGTRLRLTAVAADRDLGPRRQVGGLWLASPVETYLALARAGRRHAKLAARLRDVAIGF